MQIGKKWHFSVDEQGSLIIIWGLRSQKRTVQNDRDGHEGFKVL